MSFEHVRRDPYHPPYIEGKDVPTHKAVPYFRALVDTFRISFKDTALFRGGSIGPAEVKAAERLLEAATIINPEIFNSGTQEHIALTEGLALPVAQRMNSAGKLSEPINLFEVSLRAKIHDLGRTFSHHRVRNDLIAAQILKLAGVKPEFMTLLPNDNRLVPAESEEETSARIADISSTIADPILAVIEAVDSIAKFSGPGKLRGWAEIWGEQHAKFQAFPNVENTWPVEYRVQVNVLSHLKEHRSYFDSLVKWVEQQMDCPLEDVIQEYEKSLPNHPVTTFADSEKVQPLHFKTAVFDVGGVLLFGPASQNYDQLVANIAQKLGIGGEESMQRLAASLDEGINFMQAGQSNSEEIEKRLIKQFGKEGDSIGLNQLLQAGEYQVDPVIVNAIKYLQTRGVRVVLASNTSTDTWESLVIPHLKKAGLNIENVGEVKEVDEAKKRIAEIESAGKTPAFASYDLGARKGGEVTPRPDGLGFFPLISKILDADPKETISVDDKAANNKEAKETGYKEGYTYTTAADFILSLSSI